MARSSEIFAVLYVANGGADVIGNRVRHEFPLYHKCLSDTFIFLTLGSQVDDCEYYCLMRRDTVKFGASVMFWKNLLYPSYKLHKKPAASLINGA